MPIGYLVLVSKPLSRCLSRIRAVNSDAWQEHAPSIFLGICRIVWRSCWLMAWLVFGPIFCLMGEDDDMSYDTDEGRLTESELEFFALFTELNWVSGLVFGGLALMFLFVVWAKFDRFSKEPDIYAASNMSWHLARLKRISKNQDEPS